MPCASTLVFLFLAFTNSNPELVFKKADLICYYSQKKNINPLLVFSVVKVETDGRHLPYYNKTWDIGLFQLHCPPETTSPWCRCNQKKLRCNIKSGINFLYYLKKKWSGRKYHYIRYYNYNSIEHYRRVMKIYKQLIYMTGGINEIQSSC